MAMSSVCWPPDSATRSAGRGTWSTPRPIAATETARTPTANSAASATTAGPSWFAPSRTDYDWISRDEEQVDRYIADPRCGFVLDTAGNKAMFLAARQMADPNRLDNIRKTLPVYIMVGEHDPAHGQLALVHALVERLRSAGLHDVTLQTYPGARHEVFNETNREEVYADLAAWLNSKLHQAV